MSRPVVCPHCGEELDIPSELRGRNVRCASCHNVFTAAADAPPPPRATRARPTAAPRATRSGGTPRQAFDDDRAPWDDSPRRRRKKGSLVWLWLLLGAGTLVVCVGCSGLVILAVRLDNPDFTTHESAKGRFTADFPGVPLEAQRVGTDGLPRECTEATRELILGTEETYFVRYHDLPEAPVGEDARYTALVNACVLELGRLPGTQENSRTRLTVSGHPALDSFMTHPDGTASHVRFVVAGKRLYAAGITGVGLQPHNNRLRHFLSSFKIVQGEGQKNGVEKKR